MNLVVVAASVAAAYMLSGWLGLNSWVYMWTKGLYYTYQVLVLTSTTLGLLIASSIRGHSEVNTWRTLMVGGLLGYCASFLALLTAALFMAGGAARFAAQIDDPSAHFRLAVLAAGSGSWFIGMAAAWLAASTLRHIPGRLRFILVVAGVGTAVQVAARATTHQWLLRF